MKDIEFYNLDLEFYNLDLIDRKKLLEDIGDEPENWTDSEHEIQCLNDWKMYRNIIESQDEVDNYKYEINNLRKIIRELNYINNFGIVFCYNCKWASPIYHSPECYDDDYIWCSENDMCYDVEHYCKDGVKKDD